LSATALANGWQKLGEVQASRRQALQPATGACQTLANMQLAQPKQHPWSTRAQQQAQVF